MTFQRYSRIRMLCAVAMFLSLTTVASALTYYYLPDYRNIKHEQKRLIGTAVLDRNGNILRLFPDGKGRMGPWCEVDLVPKHLITAVIAAEDQRFYYHFGFDPIAVMRATYTNIRQSRRVSGASTITQQVVRLIQPRPRTFSSKLVELLCAMKWSASSLKSKFWKGVYQHCKKEHLHRYLAEFDFRYNNRYGKGIEDVERAEILLRGVIGRRLTYQTTNQGGRM